MTRFSFFITLLFTATYSWAQLLPGCSSDFTLNVITEHACEGQATKISLQVPQSTTAVFSFGDGTTGIGVEENISGALFETIDHVYSDARRFYTVNAIITVNVGSATYPAGYTCKTSSLPAYVILTPQITSVVDCAGKSTAIKLDVYPNEVSGTINFGDLSSAEVDISGKAPHVFAKPGSYLLSANVTVSAQGKDNRTYSCPSSVSQAIVVPSCSDFLCENTDLETGNFTRWTTTTYGNGCTNNDCAVEGPISNEHVVVSGNGKDPYGGFPVVASGGRYSMKLGNDSNDQSTYFAEYSPLRFTADKKVFAYRVAAVIEVPGDDFFHLIKEPSISFGIYSTGEGGYNDCSEIILNSTTQGFQKINGKNASYLTWTTLYFDLSDFIGEEMYLSVRAEKGNYATTGETLKNLFAYVYFDSYCTLPPLQVTGNCLNAATQFSAPIEGPFQGSIAWDTGDGQTYTGNNISKTYSSAQSYSVTMTYNPPNLSYQGTYDENGVTCGGLKMTQQVQIDQCTPPNFVCEDCIPSFSPLPGQKYILQAWVKQGNGIGYNSYDAPGIKVNFLQGTVSDLFKPTGLIIDGWQRIEGEFMVPMNATKIKIELHNDNNTIEVFYDDIRIEPINASMKAFVFDPVTLRMSAELDERNYATFFEYDEEGLLIRTKKETERGIKTISESRSSLIKRKP